jgi:predicted nucleic acid-binding protein
MSLILADTSAWIEFDRATGSAADLRLKRLIASTDAVATTEPVMMEIFAGARDDRRLGDLRRLLLRFRLLPFDPVVDFEGAARLYRTCRRSGVTPRGLIDCMVAAVASRHGARVLAHDLDFARMASVVSLRLDAASLHAGRSA